MVAEY